MQQYMLKVIREAKVHTSWVSPNEAYEAGVVKFVKAILTGDRRRPFLQDLDEFAAKVVDHGRWNSLSQVLLKVGSPGVPDFYQGTELWTLTLVDPDNRHPVDLGASRESLSQLQKEMAQELDLSNSQDAIEAWLRTPSVEDKFPDGEENSLPRQLIKKRMDGRIKQFVTLISLRTRRQFPGLFTLGEYLPLTVTGKFAESVVAFARRHQDQVAVVIAPRLTVSLAGLGGPSPVGPVWEDTAIHLPDFLLSIGLMNRFTREVIHPLESENCLPMSELFRSFPLALLTPTRP